MLKNQLVIIRRGVGGKEQGAWGGEPFEIWSLRKAVYGKPFLLQFLFSIVNCLRSIFYLLRKFANQTKPPAPSSLPLAFCLLISTGIQAQSFQPDSQTGQLPNILQTFTDGENVRQQAVLVVNHNTEKRYTAVHAVIISNSSSRQSRFVFIDSVQVGTWSASPEKGKVRQNFKNAVLSGEKKNGHIPLEFQYEFQASPDKKHFLVYRYDYSQPVLYANLFVLDSTLSVIYKTQISIDENTTVHGFYLTDDRKIVMLNSSSEENLDIFVFDPKTEQADLISLEAGNLKRRSFTVFSGASHQLSIANLCEVENNVLEGVMVSIIDLEKKKVQKILYHPFTEDFAKNITQSPQTGFFDIVEFSVNEREEASVILEKHHILSNIYQYNPYQANDIVFWKPRPQKAETGEKISIGFFLDGKLVREEVLK